MRQIERKEMTEQRLSIEKKMVGKSKTFGSMKKFIEEEASSFSIDWFNKWHKRNENTNNVFVTLEIIKQLVISKLIWFLLVNFVFFPTCEWFCEFYHDSIRACIEWQVIKMNWMTFSDPVRQSYWEPMLVFHWTTDWLCNQCPICDQTNFYLFLKHGNFPN